MMNKKRLMVRLFLVLLVGFSLAMPDLPPPDEEAGQPPEDRMVAAQPDDQQPLPPPGEERPDEQPGDQQQPPPPPQRPQNQPRMGQKPTPEKMIEQLTRELQLTPEQSKKILEEVKKNEEATRALHEKNRELFEQIEKELTEDSPNRGKLLGIVKQVNENDTQIQTGRIDQLIAMRKELTPMQKERMKKIMEERKARAGNRNRFFRW